MVPVLFVSKLGMWQGTAQIIKTIEGAHSSEEVALGAEEILQESSMVEKRTDLFMPCGLKHVIFTYVYC